MNAKLQFYLHHANNAYATCRYEDAIAYYTEALEINKNDTQALANRSSCYALIGKYNESANDANQILHILPCVTAYSLKGNAEFMLGRYEEALISYKEGLQIEPNNTVLIEGTRKCTEKIELSKKEFQKDISKLTDKLINDASTKEYFSQPDFVDRLNLLSSNPQILMQLLQTDPRFVGVFSALTGINFDNSEFNISDIANKMKADEIKQIGNEYYKLKNWDSAIRQYDEAISIYKCEPIYYLNKAAALLEKNLYEECIKACDQGIKIGKQYHSDHQKLAKGYSRKASCYYKMGDIENAMKSYQQSLRELNDPEIALALTKLQEINEHKHPHSILMLHKNAIQLLNQGNFPSAIQQFSEAISKDPLNITLLLERATAYCKLLEWGKALQDIDTSISINPINVKSYFRKGSIYYYLKEFHKAAEAFNIGLQIDPLDPECKAGRAKVIEAVLNTEVDEGRYMRAMNDPEIQMLLKDSRVINELNKMREYHMPLYQIHFADKHIEEAFEKLWFSGVLTFKKREGI